MGHGVSTMTMTDNRVYIDINGVEVETHSDFEGDTIPAVIMEGPLMGYEILIPRNRIGVLQRWKG